MGFDFYLNGHMRTSIIWAMVHTAVARKRGEKAQIAEDRLYEFALQEPVKLLRIASVIIENHNRNPLAQLSAVVACKSIRFVLTKAEESGNGERLAWQAPLGSIIQNAFNGNSCDKRQMKSLSVLIDEAAKTLQKIIALRGSIADDDVTQIKKIISTYSTAEGLGLTPRLHLKDLGKTIEALQTPIARETNIATKIIPFPFHKLRDPTPA